MFTALNWFFYIVTALWLGFLFFKKRHYFIKPSIILITLSHIFFQLPLALYANKYEHSVPEPYIVSLLINSYIIIGLFVNLYTFQKSSVTVWNRITSLNISNYYVNTSLILSFSIIILIIVTTYLLYVPFCETGLYAVLKNPDMAALARERSLKLLDNRVLVYAYSIMTSVFAPLLTTMLFLKGLQYLSAKKFFPCVVIGILIFFLLIAVSLPGARVSAVNLLLVMTIAFLLLKGIPFHPVKLCFLMLLIISPGVLVGIYRDGKDIGLDSYFSYLWDFIGRRILQDPIEGGTWYVHQAQTKGFFGIVAIPKLASMIGYDPINIPNLIGLRYQPGAGPSVSACAGYLLTYYSYFGPFSLIISLACLWLSDMVLYGYMALKNSLLIPCISAISLSTFSFISSDYTTVLITHGFALILIVSLVANISVSGRADAIPQTGE